MMNMTAKVSFELTKEGKVTVQIHGEMPEEIKQFFDKLFGGVK
jgi:hypothetical protein